MSWLATLTLSVSAVTVQAAIIDFTGGQVVRNDSSTATTSNSAVFDVVDYYEEDGFRLDFNPNSGNAFESYIGDYYGVGNDVIHGHWATGNFGGLEVIKVTKIDGGSFDLNYFTLTSNTAQGGGPATGNEKAYIHASLDGITASFSLLLPTEDWGFPATHVFLGSPFDNIKAFWFTVANQVDCFGMDDFYIDQDAPPIHLPEPAGIWLFGLAALLFARRQLSARA